MHAALLQNNNNAPYSSGFKADPRSSVGRSQHLDAETDQSWQRYAAVDVIAAAAIFPEILGEDPTARVARLRRWIAEAIPIVKEAREKREGAAFLAGAQLADMAATERHAAETQTAEARHAALMQLKIEQIVEIVNAVRRETAAVAAPVAAPPSTRSSSGVGLFIGGLVVGGLLVAALHKSAPPRRSSRSSRR